MDMGGSFPTTMTKLANKSFFEVFDAHESVYDKVFAVKDCAEMGGLNYGTGTAIVDEGEPDEIGFTEDHKVRPATEGFTYFWATRLFQHGFEVSQDFLDNWKNNPRQAEDYVKNRAANIARSMKRWRDKFCAQILNRGSISAGDTNYFFGTKPGFQKDPYPGKLYDGVALFNSAHPLYLDSNTTFSNINTALAFSYGNLKTALNTYCTTNAKDERNLPFSNVPDVIVVGSKTMELDVRAVLESERQAGSSNNDKNVIGDGLSCQYWDQISDADGWYLGAKMKGLCFVKNGEPQSNHEVRKFEGKGVYKWTIIDEFTAMAHQWRHWYAANVATS